MTEKKQRTPRQPVAVGVADMECLSTETASRVYDIPESTLREYARDGKIPGAHRKGKRWILPKEGLAEYFKATVAPAVS
jgi:excisionase family DNA binding protein